MEKKVTLNDRTFKVMISHSELDALISKVAERINRDYADSKQPPIMVGVLNGAFIFMAELALKITIPVETAFVKISSYEGISSTGVIREQLGLTMDVTGRDIILVEDIIETGNSINYLLNTLKDRGCRSVEVCTLCFKPNRLKKDINIKYCVKEIGDDFIVGYGLDYDQIGRNLPDIYVLDNE